MGGEVTLRSEVGVGSAGAPNVPVVLIAIKNCVGLRRTPGTRRAQSVTLFDANRPDCRPTLSALEAIANDKDALPLGISVDDHNYFGNAAGSESIG